MSAIQFEYIGINRNAPPEARGIVSYIFNGESDLTLGRLMMAVCCQRSAVIERQSVLKMNQLSASTTFLKASSMVMEQVLAGGCSLSTPVEIRGSGYDKAKGKTIKQFLMEYCDVRLEDLQVDGTDINISTHDNAIKIVGYLRKKMDAASASAQQETIQLQSLVSRRDATYNTSASSVKRLMQTAMGVASNY